LCTSSASSRELLVFSFQRPLHHRDLHSFPTRRSSDLRACRPTCDLQPGERSAGGVRRSAPAERRTEPRRRRRGSPPIAPGTPGKDRKSTRLNSSHEWISYAVFCLKKKSNKDRSCS